MRVFILNSKKANAVVDTLTVVVMLFILSIGIVAVYSFLKPINDDIQADPQLSNLTKNVTGRMTGNYPYLWDSLFVMAWTLVVLGLLVSVIFLDTHPVFFFFSIVGLICVFGVTYFLANAYDDLMTDPTLSVYAAQFPYITWVMTHLLEVSVAVGFITLIALFIKLRNL